MSKKVYHLPTDASFIWVEATNCETGFVNTTARPDSLANLTRDAIMIHGDDLPIAPERLKHPVATPNDVGADAGHVANQSEVPAD